MTEPMGGYFELELAEKDFIYPDAMRFNSARSALQALLLAERPSNLYVPYFTCPVVPQAALNLGISVTRYQINSHLEPIRLPKIRATEKFLYINYFGYKDCFINEQLAPFYKEQLILDNAQALFSKPLSNVPTIYSPRKFLGVPDGGLLCEAPPTVNQPETHAGFSSKRLEPLIGRLTSGPEEFYSAFVDSEKSLEHEGVMGMSKLTSRILKSVDYDQIIIRRQLNLAVIHNMLGPVNEFTPWSTSPPAGLSYPLRMRDQKDAYRLRKLLQKERIYIPVYWPDIMKNMTLPEYERSLTECIVSLPIDQRYGTDMIEKLGNLILGSLKKL